MEFIVYENEKQIIICSMSLLLLLLLLFSLFFLNYMSIIFKLYNTISRFQRKKIIEINV